MNHRILIIGSTNTDMVVRAGRLPAPGETVLGGEFTVFAGGKGANQAVAARRAGGAVTFLTAVGDDSFGAQAIANFEREGIDTSLLKTVPGVASGVALIVVDARGENMIAVAPGANAHLLPEDVERVDFSLYSYVVLQLETPLATVEVAARRARQAGCRVVLNPAPAAPLPATLLAEVDLLTPNRGELALLADGVNPPDTEAAVIEAAARLRARGVGALVVTLGAAGSLCLAEGEPLRTPAPPVAAVDAVGAGDCFTGALVAALARQQPLAAALRFATAAASLSVQRPGAQSSFPALAEIERQLIALEQ